MKKFLIFVNLFLCLAVKAQTTYYYYYKGEKVYLSLNTGYVYLSLKEQQFPVDIQQRGVKVAKLKSDLSDQLKYRAKKGSRRFYTELKIEENLSDEQYLKLLSEMKRQNKNAIISPYFKINGNDKVGLSNFFYVKLKEEKDTTKLRLMTERTRTVILDQYRHRPLWFTLSTTEASELNALECSNLYFETGWFQSASPDLMDNTLLCVNDPKFGDQWGLKNNNYSGGTTVDIKACDAWRISTGKNITVAIIDEGVFGLHPDLTNNFVSSACYNTVDGTMGYHISAGQKHGTFVAGIIGAEQKNSEGISGVAPNCKLISIHNPFSSPNNHMRLADGVDYAWSNGADVINCSWGAAAPKDEIEDAINAAVTQGRGGKGCVVVAATGNDGVSSVWYPAAFDNVIAVGAINRSGTRAYFSNSGDALNVVAPGVGIMSTSHKYNWEKEYKSDDGTSFAAPHVSGIAALILSIRPDLISSQVKSAIESTCLKVNAFNSSSNPYGYPYSQNSTHPNGTWFSAVGHGLVNAYEAVNSVVRTIIVPSYICGSNGYSFTATARNAPSGYTWTCSSNLTPGTISGNNRTFSVNNYNGSTPWVAVNSGSTELLREYLNVQPAPVVYGINGPENVQTMSTYDYSVNMDAIQAPLTYNWTIQSGSHYINSFGSYAYINFYDEWSYYLQVYVSNACGSDYATKYITSTSGYGYYSTIILPKIRTGT